MNRANIRTLIRTFLNEPTEGLWLDTELNTAINLANQKINAVINSIDEDYFTTSKTFSTTALSKSYAFPSDCQRIRRLEHYSTADASDVIRLDEIGFPRTELQGDWPFSQSGKPMRYQVRGTQFDLLPIPDAVYTMKIYYDQRQVDMTQDTDSPIAPSEFHDMLSIWATILALPKDENRDDTNFKTLWDNRYNDLILAISGRKGSDVGYVEGYLEGRY